MSAERIEHQLLLAELDNLGQEMLAHFYHDHADQVGHIRAVMNLAAKVWTVHNLVSTDSQFEALRAEWKETIRRAVFQEALATGSDSSATSPGS